MATMTLAEALLRRKELAGRVETSKMLKEKDVFTVKAVRKNVTESIDDIVATVPKLTLSQVTQEHDFYAKQLRLIDALIQKANWSTVVDTGTHDLTADYVAPATAA